MRIGRTGSRTDTGRRRLQNEDAYVCDPPLFAVADGMGGAQAGELASRLAATALEERRRGARGEEAVAELVQAANDRVYRRALEDTTAAGMGTTVTAALFDGETGSVAIGHVGDSRAYRIREGRLDQLTTDHSLVGELVRSGRLTPEQAAEHPHRSVITRALGTEASVTVDTFTMESVPGDLYLICSDGLTGMLGDDEILTVAAEAGNDPDGAARALVDAANRAGGEDNITVVVFEVVDGEPDPEPEREPAPQPEAADAGAAPDEAAPPADTPVSRRGAGKGGRALASLALFATLAAGALVVWWSIRR